MRCNQNRRARLGVDVSQWCMFQTVVQARPPLFGLSCCGGLGAACDRFFLRRALK